MEVKGRIEFDIDPNELVIPVKVEPLSFEEITREVKQEPFRLIAATAREGEHSAGMREIIDIKHGGLEKYGFKCYYLGTSAPVKKLVDAAIEAGIRDKVILVGGGTQITDGMARECGLDASFGRGTKGIDVASFLIRRRKQLVIGNW